MATVPDTDQQVAAVPAPDFAADFSTMIRDITPAEVASFKEHGWVHLPALIDPVVAGDVLRRAQAIMGMDAGQVSGGGGGDPAFAHYRDILRNYLGAWERDPMLHALSHSPEMGRVASRLLRDGAVRFLNDEILVKVPVAQNGKPTPWHQDFPHAAYDRTAMVNIWIAIVDLPPTRGAMRFLSGSHRAGPLGRTLLDKADVLEQNPWLADEYPVTPALEMKAGDATAHGDLTVHGGPANTSDGVRWAYLVNLFDAAARYSGGPSYGSQIEGVEVNGLYDTDRYPVTYPGANG